MYAHISSSGTVESERRVRSNAAFYDILSYSTSKDSSATENFYSTFTAEEGAQYGTFAERIQTPRAT